MGNKYRNPLLGGIIAITLGTSCCWLSFLAVWLGGATVFTVIGKYMEENSTLLLGIAFICLAIASYRFWKYKSKR